LVVRGPLTRQEQDTGEPQGQTRAMRRSHGGIHRRGSGPKSAGGDAGREEGQNENGVENMAQIRDAAFGAETQSSPSGASRTSGSSRRDPSPIGQASQPRLRPHWPVFWAGVKALGQAPETSPPATVGVSGSVALGMLPRRKELRQQRLRTSAPDPHNDASPTGAEETP
jgi:hypothetical protein